MSDTLEKTGDSPEQPEVKIPYPSEEKIVLKFRFSILSIAQNR